jgi:hypothetical protein
MRRVIVLAVLCGVAVLAVALPAARVRFAADALGLRLLRWAELP